MAGSPPQTAELLCRWHGGDAAALEAILHRELPWIRGYVRRHLAGGLRQRAETEDFVQEALLKVLRFGPRFIVSDQGQLRALLGRIVVNVLHDQHKWHGAQRRAQAQEVPLPSTSVVNLDSALQESAHPLEAADSNERESWIRIGLQFLEPEDRLVIVLRDWEALPFATVGERMGLTEKAARMRYVRALPRLADQIERLRSGKLDMMLKRDEPDGPDRPEGAGDAEPMPAR